MIQQKTLFEELKTTFIGICILKTQGKKGLMRVS